MITVGRNQNQIFGKIDGVKFPNLPLNNELFEKLKALAKQGNEYESKNLKVSYIDSVINFRALVESKEVVAQVKEVKTEKKSVKVGSGKLKVELVDDKPYLFNQAGLKSKFYIPKFIYQRIQAEELKENGDVTPLFKFMIRALKGEKMTQDKLNRLDVYMNQDWFDQELYSQLLEKGYTESKAKTESTFKQVPITLEGLIQTYKVSTIVTENGLSATEYVEGTQEEDEELGEEVAQSDSASTTAIVDTSSFKFAPVRNKKGHFLARGSDEYMAEYNKQLADFVLKNHIVNPTVVLNKKNSTEKVVVPAKQKAAENYVFQPYYQGQSGDAFYCGDKLGHEIRVGYVHKLPSWSMVNTSDGSSALPGLHVGGLQYIHDSTYYDGNKWKKNALTHNVFVDPQFVGAVASSDDEYGALRVKEYFVHSVFIAPNKGVYNSSTYAAQTDKEWDEQLLNAMITVEEAEKKIAKIKEEANKAQSLIDNSFSL